MEKKMYQKPNAERVFFSVQDELMDTGTVGPSGKGTITPEPPSWGNDSTFLPNGKIEP